MKTTRALRTAAAAAALATLLLAGCAPAPIRPVMYDEAADRRNPNMTPDTPEELADQQAALALVREANVIREKPMAEVSMADRSRLRAIDSELRAMRLKYLDSGRSADHLSGLGLDEAMRREAEAGARDVERSTQGAE